MKFLDRSRSRRAKAARAKAEQELADLNKTLETDNTIVNNAAAPINCAYSIFMLISYYKL
jgi:hypothetical protein